MNLWSSFSPTSNDQWREKIQKDLKGNTIDSIYWETPYGSIDPTLEVSKKYCNGNVVSILEGGYDLQALAESSEQHVNALMQFKKE